MTKFLKHKEIHKFIWETRVYKSVIDYFITNINELKIIHIRVYRSIELDTDHYLLCAKVDFPLQRLDRLNSRYTKFGWNRLRG
jgi:hypothetical protein